MKRVLIVDDKEANLYYLQVLLQGNGYEVESARHGAEALVKARQSRPDVVISDLLMPVMDGYTLLRYWKADPNLKSIPFIVYTATYTEPEDERLALSLGADAFILKPAEPEDFIAKLREVKAQEGAPTRQGPSAGEEASLREYSEILIRKLEDKSLQLEEANRALQRDIAERNRLTETVQESERRFRQLAENINEVFWITDPAKDQLIYVSPAYESIWGRSCDSLYAAPQTWLAAIHAEDRERVRQAVATRQVAGEYDETYRIARPDGKLRWIRDRAFPVRDAEGKVLRIVGIAGDITERKFAQERISEQAALIDQARDAIIVRDLEPRIIFWNKGAERLYGWTAEEALGRRLDELLHVDAGVFKIARQAILEKGEWSGEIEKTGKAGVRLTLDCRWTLLCDPEGKPKSILSIDTDITERKKIEAQFLRAQRLESIGTLAGGIAHDLNNILAPIMMSIEMLQFGETDKDRLEVLATIEASAKRGADMVAQVLSFARGVEGRRMEVQVKHLLRDVEKIANDTFLKNIHARAVFPSNLWLVMGDPTQLHQVILNLCVNARDAMPDGGKLILAAENLMVGPQNSEIAPGIKPGPYVVIRVEDTGIGMPPAVMDRIFEPFFTTKDLGKGTGLGLSTSLAIVNSHGGFIRVYSEPGKGTMFKVWLPAQTTPGAEQGQEAAAEPPRGNGELILVVDDEHSVREITKGTLEAFGYRVLLASDGAAAVSLLVQHLNEVAVVLTDMMMPVLDGPSTIQVLLRMNPGLRIVAASGLNDEGRAGKALAAGAKCFLAKPYTAETLLKTLKKTLLAP